jgi:hypothetical protein
VIQATIQGRYFTGWLERTNRGLKDGATTVSFMAHTMGAGLGSKPRFIMQERVPKPLG